MPDPGLILEGHSKDNDAMSLKNVNPVNPNHQKHVAIVISNPAISTSTGWPVGFWWRNLITGQQNFSDAETAKAVIEALGR